jgi:hypothetical protein
MKGLARRAGIIGALALGVASLAAAASPAASVAAPSSAQAELGGSTGFGEGFVGYVLQVTTNTYDPEAHHLWMTYDGGSFVISDTAGIAPQPPNPLDPESQNDPEDVCAAQDPTTVRCPIDTNRSDLVLLAIDITTGAGNDSVDLRSLPPLPVRRPPDGTESSASRASPRVIMAQGNDRLLSGPAGQSESSLGRGNDVFVGAAGDDYVVSGSYGNDRLFGGGGSDYLAGTSGNDLVKGGPGHDQLLGDLGDDRLLSRDGMADAINCGVDNRGHDSVVKDRFDHPFRHRFGRRINCS